MDVELSIWALETDPELGPTSATFQLFDQISSGALSGIWNKMIA